MSQNLQLCINPLWYGKDHNNPKQFYKFFSPERIENAICMLSYGTKILKHKIGYQPQERFYYIFEDDIQYLQYLKPSREFVKCRIPLSEINNLTDIPTSEKFQNLKRDHIIQIEFHGKSKLLEFQTKLQRDLWWQGLQHFIELSEQELQQMKRVDFPLYLSKKTFLLGDSDGSQSLTYDEIKKTLMLANVNVPEDQLKKLFKVYDADGSGMIEFDEFKRLFTEMMSYEEIKDLFIKYASQKQNQQYFMLKTDFKQFLYLEQKWNISTKQLNELFGLFSVEQVINLKTFTSFLLSPGNSAYSSDKQLLYQPLDRPLTDYYINSSHNTYLMSNQLTGESSVQAYINSFRKGCRCVELDCWDGPQGQPIIYHGYTMTSRITFESVVKTIKEFGFKYSKMPLILSLEVHCSVQQQDIMAQIMEELIGKYLLRLPPDWEQYHYYPTPQELQEKIIIKNKGKMESIEFLKNKEYESNQTSVPQQIQEDEELTIPIKKIKNQNKKPLYEFIESYVDPYTQCDIDDYDLFDQRSSHQKYVNKENKLRVSSLKKNLTRQLYSGQLTTTDEMIKKTGNSKALTLITTLFGVPLSMDRQRSVWEISSLDEKKISSLSKQPDITKFHQRFFTRIYPSGARIDSSNYDPIDSYNVGSQIIALNFQTSDTPMLINYCKFLENGGISSGLVLKPSWMCHDAQNLKTVNDFEKQVYDAGQLLFEFQLNLKIICGFNLSCKGFSSDIVDPFIKITIRGSQFDEGKNPQVVTPTVMDNGLNPRFGFSYQFKFTCPDLAILILEVFDENVVNHELVGWFAIPINCLATGYRNIQLLDKNLIPLENSQLLVHIELNKNK